MNSSATARKSMIRTSMMPLPVTRVTGMETMSSGIGQQWRRRAGDTDVSEAERQKVVSMLDYLDYRARCNMEQEQLAGKGDAEPVMDCYADPFIEVEVSHAGRFTRMLTIFPYREASWVVAMLFVVGSISFTINAFLGVLPIVRPDLVFDTLDTQALPYTIIIGAVLFLSGGTLGALSGWNADRGTLEALEGSEPVKSQKGNRGPDMYRSALLGSAAWVWLPSSTDLARVLATVPFRVGVSQLAGGMILSTSAVTGFPGVLNPEENFELFKILVFWPQIISGSIFFFANLALVFFVQDTWYKPKPSSSDWHASGWNTLGGSGFALTGVFLVLEDNNAAAWISLYGSLTFMVGSLISWYSIMEFHPTGWAT